MEAVLELVDDFAIGFSKSQPPLFYVLLFSRFWTLHFRLQVTEAFTLVKSQLPGFVVGVPALGVTTQQLHVPWCIRASLQAPEKPFTNADFSWDGMDLLDLGRITWGWVLGSVEDAIGHGVDRVRLALPIFGSHQPWIGVQFSFFFSATFITGWWFGTFFIFPYIGNNHPSWPVFFRGVETTNQIHIDKFHGITLRHLRFPTLWCASSWQDLDATPPATGGYAAAAPKTVEASVRSPGGPVDSASCCGLAN